MKFRSVSFRFNYKYAIYPTAASAQLVQLVSKVIDENKRTITDYDDKYALYG